MSTALLVAALLAVSGCAHRASTTDDMTAGVSSKCEVHGIEMTKRVVPLEYGLMPQSFLPYAEARAKLFPHADEPMQAGCVVTEVTHSRIYVCSRCTAAREAWLREHKEFSR